MQVIKTKDFDKQLVLMPSRIRLLFAKQEAIFLTNLRDSRLHLSKIFAMESVFSFRITKNYRCLFYFYQDDIAVFFAVDHRKDVYR